MKKKTSLHNGDILHCKRNSWLSRTIRFITRSKNVSHKALVLELEGQLFIVDSQWDGTRIRPFGQWNDKYGYSYTISRKTHLMPNLLQEVIPHLNVAYDYGSIFKHIIYKFIGIWIKGKREEDFLTCSEFIARLLKKKDAYKTSPADLYLWLLQQPDKYYYIKND